MRYRYPKINNWLVFSRTENGKYEVLDPINGELYTFEGQIARFARRLDGSTDPYSISDYLTDQEVTSFLRELDKHSLLRRSRVMNTSSGEMYCTLWTPKEGKRVSLAPILNQLLLLLFFPVFAAGTYFFFRTRPLLSGEMTFLNAVIGVVVGMMLHELAHMNASISYGGRVFEMGIFLKVPFPGAYVLMDTSPVRGELKRAQINAAGIEANLLLAGIMFFLATILSWNSKSFFYIAFLNTELAVVNLLLIDGLDGAGIISALLGIEEVAKDAKSFLKNMLRGEELRPAKRSDLLYSTMCFTTALVQPVYAVLFILNIWGMIECIL